MNGLKWSRRRRISVEPSSELDEASVLDEVRAKCDQLKAVVAHNQRLLDQMQLRLPKAPPPPEDRIVSALEQLGQAAYKVKHEGHVAPKRPSDREA